MFELSLCMIVKNEENYLGKCLASVKGIFDEIIIVDTGSTDRTKEIAMEYGATLYDFVWINDFAAARNFSFSKATKEYIMWLDADDIILPLDQERLLNLKNQMPSTVNYVLMPYHCSFTEMGELLDASTRERIVKRSCDFKWESPIHEFIRVDGMFCYCDATVTHTGVNDANEYPYFDMIETQYVSGARDLSVLNYYAEGLVYKQRYEEAVGVFADFFCADGFKTPASVSASISLHSCYVALGDDKNALLALENYMEFCEPRAEIYCQAGFFYRDTLGELDEAIKWFEAAVNCKEPEIAGSIDKRFYFYIPNFELGKCYIKTKRYEEALACFDNALQYNFNYETCLEIRNKIAELIKKTTR